MKAPMFTLVDDGTLDTVLICDVCGEELRFNPDPANPGGFEEGERVEAALNMAVEDHYCEGAP